MKKTLLSFLETVNDKRSLIPRIIVGFVFLSEGFQKLLFVELVGTSLFREIGFTNYYFWTYFVSSFEIICGALIMAGLFVRFASVPLLIIMITAIFTTKLPLLSYKGFWSMIHESEIDLAMIGLLVFLLIYGAGKGSFDYKYSIKHKQ
jgi:uncharacterized membrane protein YphA (DoxX/SURF4 family)